MVKFYLLKKELEVLRDCLKVLARLNQLELAYAIVKKVIYDHVEKPDQTIIDLLFNEVYDEKKRGAKPSKFTNYHDVIERYYEIEFYFVNWLDIVAFDQYDEKSYRIEG